jgi:hypothetical protein
MEREQEASSVAGTGSSKPWGLTDAYLPEAENGRERLRAGGSGRYRKREHRERELCLSL